MTCPSTKKSNVLCGIPHVLFESVCPPQIANDNSTHPFVQLQYLSGILHTLTLEMPSCEPCKHEWLRLSRMAHSLKKKPKQSAHPWGNSSPFSQIHPLYNILLLTSSFLRLLQADQELWFSETLVRLKVIGLLRSLFCITLREQDLALRWVQLLIISMLQLTSYVAKEICCGSPCLVWKVSD